MPFFVVWQMLLPILLILMADVIANFIYTCGQHYCHHDFVADVIAILCLAVADVIAIIDCVADVVAILISVAIIVWQMLLPRWQME